jgi:hypothetical protein|tara:strand:+ start:399 stop:698 length:300 start_codon:yes stop_codon:yes gene_type:complete
MAYNITALGNADTLSGLIIVANDAVEGILIGLFMFAVFFVMLMALKKWDFDAALLSSSFSCFILSMILSYGGFLNLIFPLVFLAMAGLTALYMFTAKKE